MKIGDYITSKDWNALGRKNQRLLRNSLRFMGFRCRDNIWPSKVLNRKVVVVYLYDDGDLSAKFHPTPREHPPIPMSEILSFIELTSFGVRE